MNPGTDDLGRPVVSDSIKKSISEAFAFVPSDKRGAFLLIADKDSDTVRVNVAAKINDQWKVAAGAGWEFGKKDPATAYIAVVGTW